MDILIQLLCKLYVDWWLDAGIVLVFHIRFESEYKVSLQVHNFATDNSVQGRPMEAWLGIKITHLVVCTGKHNVCVTLVPVGDYLIY